MVDASLVAGIVGAALVVPILELLVLAGRRKRGRRLLESREIVLEYALGLKGLAVFGIVFWTAVLLISTRGLTDVSGWASMGTPLLSAVLVAIVGPISLLAVEAFGTAHILSPEGLRKRSPWSKPFSVRWEEIESIAYSRSAEWFVVKTSKGKIRLHRYLSGLGDLAEAVRTHVPPERWSKAAVWLGVHG